MGFRNGAYAMVSAGRDKDGSAVNPVRPMSDSWTKVRLYISYKDKETGQYESEFSRFADFFGTANAKKALSLKDKDRIKLTSTDYTEKYDKDKGQLYQNWKVFGFEKQDDAQKSNAVEKIQATVDDGEVDDSRLPF